MSGLEDGPDPAKIVESNREIIERVAAGDDDSAAFAQRLLEEVDDV